MTFQKTSLLLSHKFKLFGYGVFTIAFISAIIERIVFKHTLYGSYFLWATVIGLFITSISREKKENKRILIIRYRALKFFLIVTIPILMVVQLFELILKIKTPINLMFICLFLLLVFNAAYFYFWKKGSKREEEDDDDDD